MSPKEQIENEVSSRARILTVDQLSDLRSFARMESMLCREYHGRFLIELLQNARDAWRDTCKQGRNKRDEGLVHMCLAKDPAALVVCNQGKPIDVFNLLYSICKFGESTKHQGEGIGYKGIGFKAILEITHCPEVYSRQDLGKKFDIQVLFNPHEALKLIRKNSPRWDELKGDLRKTKVNVSEDDLDSIPILRFPMWKDDIPHNVMKKDEYKKNTTR